MASSSVTEAPSCIRRECRRTPHSGANEARKVIDVGKPVGARLVIRFLNRVAKIRNFIGLETAGDAHLVQVSIRGKRQEAGLLVLPAEAADRSLARRFDNGNVEDLAANLVVAFVALLFR